MREGRGQGIGEEADVRSSKRFRKGTGIHEKGKGKDEWGKEQGLRIVQ